MPIGTKPFRVELVTPESAIAPLDCTFASLPAWDGQIGVLAHRAPLVCKLGAGELRLEHDGRWLRYYVQDGFAEVAANTLTVLATRAVPADQLSAESARQSLGEARAAVSTDELSRNVRQQKIEQALAQLRIIERAK